MKYLKYLVITIISLLYSNNINANSITFTPTTQSVSVNSGVETQVTIQLNGYGSAPGASSWFINPHQIPDNGYLNHSPGSGAIYVGGVETVTFRFKRTVSATTTTNYIFRQEWYDETGNYHTGFLNIYVTYNSSGPATCTLSAPSNRTSTNITTTSATINWNSVSSSNGFQSQYKKSSVNTWTTINPSSSLTQSISNLEPNTLYNWRVRTRCNNGAYGNYSTIENFTTLSDNTCNLPAPNNPLIDWITSSSFRYNWTNVQGNFGYRLEYFVLYGTNTLISIDINKPNTTNYFATNLQPETVYGIKIGTKCADGSINSWSATDFIQTYIDCPENLDVPRYHAYPEPYYYLYEASNNIISEKQVLNGVKVELNAGNKIILEPGFRVYNNSSFRAFIEGCTATNTSKISKEKHTSFESTSLLEDIEIIKLYPNPTSGIVNISSKENVASWELNNSLGAIYIKENAKYQDVKAFSLNLSGYPTGMYILRTTLKNGELVIKKIIKE